MLTGNFCPGRPPVLGQPDQPAHRLFPDAGHPRDLAGTIASIT
jgi:hypothetical protein